MFENSYEKYFSFLEYLCVTLFKNHIPIIKVNIILIKKKNKISMKTYLYVYILYV